jgi:catechol 2,3-dioxygenase-like lactoylglutathione lyase family enzyme
MEKVHHLAVVVDDIAEALSWYRVRFEIETLYEDDSWAMVLFDNVSLALVLPGKHPPHFAIEREDAEAFGPLTTHRDGTASTYISDPWGNRIEILKAASDDRILSRKGAYDCFL